MKPPSRANLHEGISEAYPDPEFVQQVAGQLPWFHNVESQNAVSGPVFESVCFRETIPLRETHRNI